VSTRSLLREVWSDYRTLFPLLMGGALIVYVPISLVDSATDLVNETHDAAALAVVGALAAGLVGVLLSLLGAVVYTAIVSVLVLNRHKLHDHRLTEALRGLPYGRLVVADLLYTLLVGLGMLLLIVPGLVFMTRYALIAPVIEIEELGIRNAMRRSRELVRPYFWKVFVIVVPLTFASELISEIVWDGAVGTFGDGLVGGWIGSLLGELLTAPFLALFVVLAFLQLRRSQSAGE
jgi:hypothetical protein